MLEAAPSVAKPESSGGSCGSRGGREPTETSAGTCRWQGALGRGGSAVGVVGFQSVLGCDARYGMPASSLRLKRGVWRRGIQSGGSRTSFTGMVPRTLGPSEGGCPGDGWRWRHQPRCHSGLRTSATPSQQSSQESGARVGDPPAWMLGGLGGYTRGSPRPENGMSYRVHLKTSRLHRLGDEVSICAGLQCNSLCG